MDGSRDAKNQQKPCNEVSVDKKTGEMAGTAESVAVKTLDQRVNELTIRVRAIERERGMPKHGVLTPAPSFPLHLADDDDINKPPVSDDESLDLRLKPLMVKERYDNAAHRYMTVKDVDDEKKPSENEPFLVRTKIFMNGSETIYLDLKSRSLQTEVKKIIGNIHNINLDMISASVEVKVLFHWIWKLKEHKRNMVGDLDESGESDEENSESDGGDEDKEEEEDEDENEEEEEGKEDNNNRLSPDLELLIHWAEKYHSSVQEELDAVTKRGKIRFELLWAFFQPEDELYLQCPYTETPMCVIYQNGEEAEDRNHQPCFSLVSHYLNRAKDGQPGFSIRTITIPSFWGEKDITDLNVYPLEYHARDKQIRAELIARGRRYAELSKVSFSHQMFCGYCFFVNANSEAVVRYAKSRIVLDPDEYAKFPPGKTRVPDAVRIKGDLTWDKLDDNELLICSATAFAYVLHLRHFAEVAVDHISAIEWDESVSFEHDVMLREKEKRAITAVAEQALGESAAGKESAGHFVVFYGGPGVGKTLTANMLAEQYKAPLFQFSAAQQESGVKNLELYVDLIFRLCSRWKAVLLMDEGDVYLSKRCTGHSAVVAVFLRHIELYRGLLIVTTNRYSAMDDAVVDRVSLPVEYPPLTKEQRKELWQNTLAKQGKQELFSEAEIDKVVLNEWNGRQIMNCLKLAMALAGKKSLKFQDLLEAADLQKNRMEASERERKEASERQYF